jgi:hypothetical protein
MIITLLYGLGIIRVLFAAQRLASAAGWEESLDRREGVDVIPARNIAAIQPVGCTHCWAVAAFLPQPIASCTAILAGI